MPAPTRAFRYGRLPDEGRYASISEAPALARIERGYLGNLMRLSLLTPEIVEAIVDGRQSPEVTLPSLLKPLPAAWTER